MRVSRGFARESLVGSSRAAWPGILDLPKKRRLEGARRDSRKVKAPVGRTKAARKDPRQRGSLGEFQLEGSPLYMYIYQPDGGHISNASYLFILFSGNGDRPKRRLNSPCVPRAEG